MKKQDKVNEEPHIVNLIKLSLNDEFYVDGAYSAREALRLLDGKKDYDCIVSEIIMRGINGYELCASVRGNPRTRKIPFIFLTRKTQISDKLHAIDMGADDFITKPFDPTELRRRIKLHMK